MKEIRGGGSRKNVGTCARLIRGGAAWGAVKGAGEGVTKGVPIGAVGGAVLGANMGAISGAFACAGMIIGKRWIKMKKLNMNELKNVKGGTNWGQIGGACAGGAIWGLYFGNPLLGCANGAAGSLITQNLKSLKFPPKKVTMNKWMIN